MPNITNQEWIEQNNTRLQNIKTQIDELPEYQDIEPIYGVSDIRKINTGLKPSTYNNYKYYNITYVGDIYLIVCSNGRGFYRYNKDNDTFTLIKKIDTSYLPYVSIVDVIDDDIYYVIGVEGYTYSLTIKKYNITTGETVSNYWTPGVPQYYGADVFYMGPSKLLLNGIIYLELDLINKNIVYQNNMGTTYSSVRTSEIVSEASAADLGSNYWRLRNIKTNTRSPVLSGFVRFVNKAGNKMIIGNNLYTLLGNLSKGTLIKSNIFDSVGITPTDNTFLVHFAGDYYCCLMNGNTASNNSCLLKFNEDTNTFEYIYNLYNLSLQQCNGRNGISLTFTDNNNYLWILDSNTDTGNVLGCIYEGNRLYFNNGTNITTDKIVAGYEVKTYNNVDMIGTMPNNGALNYTSSTSPQTIPAGYTSGGTIEAVDNTIDENIIAENIKKDVEILGVTGTYESSISQQEYDECLNLTEDILDGTISLPYTALEYIEANGTQYINTLYKPTHRTSVEMSIATINLNDTFVPFGTRANGTLAFILGINFNNKSYIQYNTNTAIYSTEDSTNLLNTKLLITLDNFLGRITYNGINIDMVPEDRGVFTCTTDLYLGCSNNNGTVQYMQPYKLYYFKIYESNALVNDFIPVKRISDNEICLYDKVTRTFFTNQGTGSYIAGPEV